jgi:hypothetical protein
MVMITEQRSARLSRTELWYKSQDNRSVTSDHAGRLIQIALAVYLIPALLVVLAVGGVGMMVLAVSRLFIVPVRGPLS